jgi:hypothetical protein
VIIGRVLETTTYTTFSGYNCCYYLLRIIWSIPEVVHNKKRRFSCTCCKPARSRTVFCAHNPRRRHDYTRISLYLVILMKKKQNYVGTSKVYFIILLAVENRIIIGLIIVHRKRIEHYHVFS